jgi:Prokaryotic E2 family E
MDLLTNQLAAVADRYPGARVEDWPDGQRVLVVPGVPLGDGWSLESVDLRVLVPVGFPHVPPDCFYADANLSLASGCEPANSQVQPIFDGSYRWFSWHLGNWNPASATLDQYLRFCERRLRERR